MDNQWQTRQTLIQRAKDQSDEEAWKEFISFYKMFIYYLLNRMNVSLNEMDDLVQEILLTLWKKLESYESSKAKFRTWLSTVIRNTTINYLKQNSSYKTRKEEFKSSLDAMNSYSEPEMDKIVEREWKVYLTNLAMERIKKVFSGHALEAFKSGMEGISAEDVADKLGITVDSVYTLRGRVKKRFVREIRFLMDELEL